MGERDDRANEPANDRTSNRANDRQLDDFDRDLERDNQREGEGSTMADLAGGGGGGGSNANTQPHVSGGEEHRQHARQGQAQSPRERTPNQPPKKKEGHK